MFKKIIIFMLIFIPALAEEKKCNFYPVKPFKPLYYGQVLFDRVEYILNENNKKSLDYEITGWYGGDYQRIWIEIEGNHSLRGKGGEIERFDVLYGKLITPFWDYRIGAGYTGGYGEEGGNRSMIVTGFKGLAPYMFEVDTNIRLTTKGEIFGDFEAEYDILLTQRMALQPRIDSRFSLSKIESLGIGQGINNIKLGLRLRYEIRREFAPYIGISWTQLFGQTKEIARNEGKSTEYTDLFVGLRVWF